MDLAATLLGQLGLSSDRFEWSKDLFTADGQHFAFWTFDDGFGIANAEQGLVFDNLGKRLLQVRDSTQSETRDSALLRQGQALEQVLLDRYIELSQ